jgi:hypothetical protein
MVKKLLAATLCMAIVACAAGGKNTQAPMAANDSRQVAAEGPERPLTTPENVEAMPGNDPKAKIDELWNDIEIETKRMGLTAPAEPAIGTSRPAEPMSTIPLSTDTSCKHANNDTCTQSCTLSDSICTNADKICRLAEKLAPDAWAAGKCTQVKQSCEQANKTCCTCT